MSLPTFTANTAALAEDVTSIVTHLQGASGNTEAWHFRCSTSNNFLITLSDAAGARKFSIRDSALSEVFSVDSDGNVTLSGSITTGTFTFPTSATPTPTTEGQASWDTDDNLLAVGDAAATKIIIPTPTTAAGDIEYASGARAHSRLAIGTAGQVLTVNAGATAPSWAAPSTVKYKTATQTFSATTTYATITASSGNFDFAIGANEVWLVTCVLSVTTNGTGGLKLQFTGPASPTRVDITGLYPLIVGFGPTDGGSAVLPNLLRSQGTAFSTGFAAANAASLSNANAGNYLTSSVNEVTFTAVIANGATLGTVTLQGAQNAANSTTVLAIGSWFKAEKIS